MYNRFKISSAEVADEVFLYEGKQTVICGL